MKRHSLDSKGLSLSQSSSISNLCNQRAAEINNLLTNVNNYQKSVNVDGKTYVIVTGKPVPVNVVDLLLEKSKLHACQAFLMENIKAKDDMIRSIESSQPNISEIAVPQKPKFVTAEVLPTVGEDFGWGLLLVPEYSEYLEVEAYASHIGQFIHKGSSLDALRKELPGIPAIEWMVITDGIKSPVTIDKHHTSEVLLGIHEKLAALHRGYEQKVNYYKAKVKNLTTAENARIANVNADAQAEAEKININIRTEYELAVNKYQSDVQGIKLEFEKARQSKINVAASLRINVNSRFQGVVDGFLKTLPEE